ncbi:hypothetical protein BD311DRAFT_561405 [Dichomitus squalens]|uniref:Uncharacterized protein n=1 Tax=Dichomitus squalens TaxID=114155 RepID=A0A4Q9MAZ0_9APHY|nr:hypothetical protein BD311DRAFT_561405 [Dichomitus squalens]
MPHKRAKRSMREKQRTESGSDLAPGAKKAIENEEIPKSAARVLNAAQVQQEFAERKRKSLDGDEGSAGPSRKKRKRDEGAGKSEDRGEGEGKQKAQLRIMAGESMAHFNRRVEDSMRHLVKEAIQTSSARVRQAKKEELASQGSKKAAAAANPSSKSRATSGPARNDSNSEDEDGRSAARTKAKETGPKEFQKVDTSAPRRLNDVAQAPPELKKLPRKAKKLAAMGGGTKASGATSLKDGVLSMAQKAMMEEERERAIRLYREMKKGKSVV